MTVSRGADKALTPDTDDALKPETKDLSDMASQSTPNAAAETKSADGTVKIKAAHPAEVTLLDGSVKRLEPEEAATVSAEEADRLVRFGWARRA